MKTTAAVVVSALATAALAGCPGVSARIDPVVAEWKGASAVGNYRNTLQIDEDMGGKSTIYYYDSDGYLYYADFRVDAEAKADGKYQFSFECRGDCAWADFEMDCKMNDAGDDLDCDGDGVWSAYVFEWKLD